MSIRRGVRQDGRGCNRGVQRRRRTHHRYTLAVARGEAQVIRKAAATAASGPHRDTAESMPGNIDPSQVQDEDTPTGCLC